MKVIKWRRFFQLLAILPVFLIPIINSYSRLLLYIPSQAIGRLWMVVDAYMNNMPEFLQGGYLAYFVIGFDSIVGLFTNDKELLRQLFVGFGGSYGSITFPGITILDPIALIQYLTFPSNIDLMLILTSSVPIIIAIFFGRVFCSWVCPINTILVFLRAVAKKIKLPYYSINLITNTKLRFYLLGLGTVLLSFGIVIFPYVLPYVMLGRFFYYLTLSKILWSAVLLIGLIILLDLFIQRGLWCNYLCPSGALLSTFGLFKPIKAKRNEKNCIAACNACSSSCTWNANPKKDKLFNCSNCGDCISTCPGQALGQLNKPIARADEATDSTFTL